MPRTGPPAYAWDWFARQRLLWREVRSRLAATPDQAASVRYTAVETRTDVVPMLRADYPRDPHVRAVVDAVVAEMAFLDRTHGRFEDLGIRNAPRGLRWWWSALTGEEPDLTAPRARGDAQPATTAASEPQQLDLDEILGGYGD